MRRAIDGGLVLFGFSDHTPYTYPEGYSSHSKMSVGEMGIYFSEALRLREKYRDYIDIRIGFEAEYFPLYWESLLAEYRKYPLEYLLYAGHEIGNEPDAFSAFKPTADPERLTAYVDHSIMALETGRFSAIAHPDCLNFVGDEELYRTEMSRLISAAKRLDIPMEINMHGIRRGINYPCPAFWEEASKIGVTAYFGMDCHKPEHVANPEEIANIERFAERYKLNVIDELKLVNPLF